MLLCNIVSWVGPKLSKMLLDMVLPLPPMSLSSHRGLFIVYFLYGDYSFNKARITRPDRR